MPDNRYPPLIGYFTALFAGLSFGFIPILAAILRNLGASSVEQVALRLVFGSIFGIITLIVFAFRKDFTPSLNRKIQLTFMIQGALFVFMIIVYISSVVLNTPAGEAALLVQVHPFITLAIGRILLREKITSRKLIALLIALTGLIILVEPWHWESFLSSIVGDLFAFSNGFFYALYLLAGRWSSDIRKEISPLLSISWVLLWSLIIGIPFIALLSVLPLPSSLVAFSFSKVINLEIVLFGLLLAVCGSVIPYGLLMFTAQSIEASKASLILLVEPVGAVIFGFILLQEPITYIYLIGGLCILSAVAITLSDNFTRNDNK